MDKEDKKSILSSFFGKKSKSIISTFTVAAFLATTIWTPGAYAMAPAAEVTLPYAAKLDSNIRFAIPSEIGKIEHLNLGKADQPTVVHIQTAHGHYQAQQQIRQILHHLTKNYGVKTVLVEGSAFKLDPEILNFFPEDQKLTLKVNEQLAKHALVKGAELYLLEEKDAQAYGIEQAGLYRENGYAFVDVLTQKEEAQNFLAGMNEGIERLAAPYLNDALRNFIEREESFQKNRTPLDAWLSYIKGEAQKTLKVDLEEAGSQVEWPMMARIFKIRALSSKLDKKAFSKERDAFLKAIRRFLPEGELRREVEKILNSEGFSQQLPDPETSMLFEDMIRSLPQDFNYNAFPDVRYFIGLLLLQSELKPKMLMGEMEKLTEQIAGKLAKTEIEQSLVALLKDYRLLQKLFALQLLPEDYDRLAGDIDAYRPAKIAKRFASINKQNRVKDVRFEHLAELNALYDSALKFYAGVKARDGVMETMIEKRLQETGADRVAVITGGFHSEPFKSYFSSKDYTYALISPALSRTDKNGYQDYVRHTIEQSLNPVKKATREGLYAMSIRDAEVQGVSASAFARDMFRSGRGAITDRKKVQAFALHLKGLAGRTTAARSETRVGNSPLIEKLTEEHKYLLEKLLPISRPIEADPNLAPRFFEAILLYYLRAFLMGEAAGDDLDQALSELAREPLYAALSEVMPNLQNRRMGDPAILETIWKDRGGDPKHLEALNEYFDEVRYRWNAQLSATGNYHLPELATAYQNEPAKLLNLINQLLSKMRGVGFTFAYDDWMTGFKRRRLDRDSREHVNPDFRFSKRIVIIHNDVGASVPHPHQQPFFLPSDFIPESKTGIERFIDDHPDSIWWYRESPTVRFGEVFGWPVSTAVVEGADEGAVAAKVHDLTQTLLEKGLRFDVLLGAYVDPTTGNMRPRFFIFARNPGAESLRPNPSKFGNMWGTFEMSGELISTNPPNNPTQFDSVTIEDVLEAYTATTAEPFYQILDLNRPEKIPARLNHYELSSYFELLYIPARSDSSRLKGTKGSRPGGDFLHYYHWPQSEKAFRLNSKFSVVPNPIPFAPHGLVIFEDRTGPQDLSVDAVRNMLRVWEDVLGDDVLIEAPAENTRSEARSDIIELPLEPESRTTSFYNFLIDAIARAKVQLYDIEQNRFDYTIVATDDREVPLKLESGHMSLSRISNAFRATQIPLSDVRSLRLTSRSEARQSSPFAKKLSIQIFKMSPSRQGAEALDYLEMTLLKKYPALNEAYEQGDEEAFTKTLNGITLSWWGKWQHGGKLQMLRSALKKLSAPAQETLVVGRRSVREGQSARSEMRVSAILAAGSAINKTKNDMSLFFRGMWQQEGISGGPGAILAVGMALTGKTHEEMEGFYRGMWQQEKVGNEPAAILAVGMALTGKTHEEMEGFYRNMWQQKGWSDIPAACMAVRSAIEDTTKKVPGTQELAQARSEMREEALKLWESFTKKERFVEERRRNPEISFEGIEKYNLSRAFAVRLGEAKGIDFLRHTLKHIPRVKDKAFIADLNGSILSQENNRPGDFWLLTYPDFDALKAIVLEEIPHSQVQLNKARPQGLAPWHQEGLARAAAEREQEGEDIAQNFPFSLNWVGDFFRTTFRHSPLIVVMALLFWGLIAFDNRRFERSEIAQQKWEKYLESKGLSYAEWHVIVSGYIERHNIQLSTFEFLQRATTKEVQKIVEEEVRLRKSWRESPAEERGANENARSEARNIPESVVGDAMALLSHIEELKESDSGSPEFRRANAELKKLEKKYKFNRGTLLRHAGQEEAFGVDQEEAFEEEEGWDFSARSEARQSKHGGGKAYEIDILKAQLTDLPSSVLAQLRGTESISVWKKILVDAGVEKEVIAGIKGKFLHAAVGEFLEKNPVESKAKTEIDNRLRRGMNGRFLVVYLNDSFDYVVKTYYDKEKRHQVQVDWLDAFHYTAQRLLNGIAVPTLIIDATEGAQEEFAFIRENGNFQKTDIAIIQEKVIPLYERLLDLEFEGNFKEQKRLLQEFKRLVIEMFRRGVVDMDYSGMLANYGVNAKTGQLQLFDFGDLSSGIHAGYDFSDYTDVTNDFLEKGLRTNVGDKVADYFLAHKFKKSDFEDPKTHQIYFGIETQEGEHPEFQMEFPLSEKQIRKIFSAGASTARSEMRIGRAVMMITLVGLLGVGCSTAPYHQTPGPYRSDLSPIPPYSQYARPPQVHPAVGKPNSFLPNPKAPHNVPAVPRVPNIQKPGGRSEMRRLPINLDEFGPGDQVKLAEIMTPYIADLTYSIKDRGKKLGVSAAIHFVVKGGFYTDFVPESQKTEAAQKLFKFSDLEIMAFEVGVQIYNLIKNAPDIETAKSIAGTVFQVHEPVKGWIEIDRLSHTLQIHRIDGARELSSEEQEILRKAFGGWMATTGAESSRKIQFEIRNNVKNAVVFQDGCLLINEALLHGPPLEASERLKRGLYVTWEDWSAFASVLVYHALQSEFSQSPDAAERSTLQHLSRHKEILLSMLAILDQVQDGIIPATLILGQEWLLDPASLQPLKDSLAEQLIEQVQALPEEAFRSMETATMAGLIQGLVLTGALLKFPKMQEKLLLFSGPPAGGKGDILDTAFATDPKKRGRYFYLIGKLMLYHSRNYRPHKNEKDGVHYHFRPEKLLKTVIEKYELMKAWVNRQLQAMAIEDLDEKGVEIEHVHMPEGHRIHADDIILSSSDEGVVVNRAGREFFLEGVYIDDAKQGILLPGDKVEQVSGGTVIVTRRIEGLTDKVFKGTKPLILEGGYGWFLALKKEFPDVQTVFVAPFNNDQMEIRAQNQAWISGNFTGAVDSLYESLETKAQFWAYQAYRKLLQSRKGEVNLKGNDDDAAESRNYIIRWVNDKIFTLKNSELFESSYFFNDLQQLITDVGSDYKIPSEMHHQIQAMAYALERRISRRHGRLLLSRQPMPGYVGINRDPYERYNGILEGVMQILFRDQYDLLLHFPWASKKISDPAQVQELLQPLRDQMMRYFSLNIFEGLQETIAQQGMPSEFPEELAWLINISKDDRVKLETNVLIDHLRLLLHHNIFHLFPGFQQKLLIYSGPPEPGRRALLEATFRSSEGDFSDFVERMILYHSRMPRQSTRYVKNENEEEGGHKETLSEKDGIDYHFRSEKDITRLAGSGVAATIVNRQLQGMALKDFTENNVHVAPVHHADLLLRGDVLIAIHEAGVTVRRENVELSLPGVSINKDQPGSLFVGDIVVRTQGDTVVVDRQIDGIEGKGLSGDKPSLLECGYGWFLVLKQVFPKIQTVFVSPFTERDIRVRSRNLAWVQANIPAQYRHLAFERLFNAFHEEGENIDLENEPVLQEQLTAVVKEFQVRLENFRLIQSPEFIDDLNELLAQSFQKPPLKTPHDMNISRAMAIEIESRLISRDDFNKEKELYVVKSFSRKKRPDYGPGEIDDQYDRYNRVLEGIAQLHFRNEYAQNENGLLLANPWQFDKEAKDEQMERLTDKLVRSFFTGILAGVKAGPRSEVREAAAQVEASEQARSAMRSDLDQIRKQRRDLENRRGAAKIAIIAALAAGLLIVDDISQSPHAGLILGSIVAGLGAMLALALYKDRNDQGPTVRGLEKKLHKNLPEFSYSQLADYLAFPEISINRANGTRENYDGEGFYRVRRKGRSVLMLKFEAGEVRVTTLSNGGWKTFVTNPDEYQGLKDLVEAKIIEEEDTAQTPGRISAEAYRELFGRDRPSKRSEVRELIADESILGWESKHGKTLEQILNKFVKEYDFRGFDGADDANFPQEVDEELLRWVGNALGSVEFVSRRHGRSVQLQPGDTFVIAGDNGPSTQKFKDALIQGLQDAGINVIDLGVTVSGHLYKSISNLGAQGGLYVTRSHVEVGTNGAKPNIGGITLYGEMLQQVKGQILGAKYARAMESGSLSVSPEALEKARTMYLDSLRKTYGELAALLRKANIPVAFNLNSGSATGYVSFFQELFGEDVTLLKSEGDSWARKGLADPTRMDKKALAHPEANIAEYSQKHPDVFILNFDLDVDRVSLLQNGKLYLGDEMFYCVIEYLLAIDPYKELLKKIYPDSRMKIEFGQLVRHFGGIAKRHPKGHSKVKATIDLLLAQLVKSGGFADVAAFLQEHPGFRVVQSEYSLHFFLTSDRGEAFDDALEFSLFWLTVFSKIKIKHNRTDWVYGDYIRDLKEQGIISESIQIKEQRTPMPDDAKGPVMARMKDAVLEYFDGREDFVYVPDWESDYEAGMKPYTLINIEGVYHFVTPAGEIFWGQSNTSPKVAFGTQSTSVENTRQLAGIAAALMIQARQELVPQAPRYHPLETAGLFEAWLPETHKVSYTDWAETTPDASESAYDAWLSEGLENNILSAYPSTEAALTELVSVTTRSEIRADQAAIAERWKKIRSVATDPEGTALRQKAEEEGQAALESAQQQIRTVAKQIQLDSRLLERLLQFEKVISVKIPLTLDEGGETQYLNGYRVGHNGARGPYKGGIRYDINVTESEVKALATWMSIKNAIAGLPYGGGKGGVAVNPEALSVKELARVTRGYVEASLAKNPNAFGPLLDVPAGDIGTSSREMGWFADEYLKITHPELFDTDEFRKKHVGTSETDTPYLDEYMQGYGKKHIDMSVGSPIAVVTAKPEGKGGAKGRTPATGRGVFYVTREALKVFGERLGIGTSVDGQTVAVEAYGNVGSYAARSFDASGAKIISIKEFVNGQPVAVEAVKKDSGFNLEALDAHLEVKGNSMVTYAEQHPEDARLIAVEEFWASDVTILVLAAREKTVDQNTAKLIRAKIISEGANGPLADAETEKILLDKGAIVLGDVFTNDGGVAFSSLEWRMNNIGEDWPEIAGNGLMEDKVVNAFHDIAVTAKAQGISLREAAYQIALSRIVDAMLAADLELAALFDEERSPYVMASEAQRWKPETLPELKQIDTRKKRTELIEKADATLDDKVDQLVVEILAELSALRGSVVLIGGPRASGKPMIAERFVEKLSQKGVSSKALDLDYQTLEEIARILQGKTIVERPNYEVNEKPFQLEDDEILVLNGYYALNDEVLRLVHAMGGKTFGIMAYSSPDVLLNGNWVLTAYDLRLMRDILGSITLSEDHNIQEVIRRWRWQRVSETNAILSTWKNADRAINTYLSYELPVIKSLIGPMIKVAMAQETKAPGDDGFSLMVLKHLDTLLTGVEGWDVSLLENYQDSVLWKFVRTYAAGFVGAVQNDASRSEMRHQDDRAAGSDTKGRSEARVGQDPYAMEVFGPDAQVRNQRDLRRLNEALTRLGTIRPASERPKLSDSSTKKRSEMREDFELPADVALVIDNEIVPKLLRKMIAPKNLVGNMLRDQVVAVYGAIAKSRDVIPQGMNPLDLLRFFYAVPVIDEDSDSEQLVRLMDVYAAFAVRKQPENDWMDAFGQMVEGASATQAQKIFAETFLPQLKALIAMASRLPQDALRENFLMVPTIQIPEVAKVRIEAMSEVQQNVFVLANLLANMVPSFDVGTDRNFQLILGNEAVTLHSVINSLLAEKADVAARTALTGADTKRSEVRKEEGSSAEESLLTEAEFKEYLEPMIEEFGEIAKSAQGYARISMGEWALEIYEKHLSPARELPVQQALKVFERVRSRIAEDVKGLTLTEPEQEFLDALQASMAQSIEAISILNPSEEVVQAFQEVFAPLKEVSQVVKTNPPETITVSVPSVISADQLVEKAIQNTLYGLAASGYVDFVTDIMRLYRVNAVFLSDGTRKDASWLMRDERVALLTAFEVARPSIVEGVEIRVRRIISDAMGDSAVPSDIQLTDPLQRTLILKIGKSIEERVLEGQEIPEEAWAQIQTVQDLVNYVKARVDAAASRSEVRAIFRQEERSALAAPATVLIPEAAKLIPPIETASDSMVTIQGQAQRLVLENEIEGLITPEEFILIEQYYFGILPLRLYETVYQRWGLPGVAQALQKIMGIPVAYAANGISETAALSDLIPGDRNLIVSDLMPAVNTAVSKATIQPATTTGGSLALGLGMFQAFIQDNPRALYYLLKSFASRSDIPALAVVGSQDLIPAIEAAITKKGVVDAAEFETRRNILAELDQGKILRVISPKTGETETEVFNRLAQEYQGGIATLHLNTATLPGLKDGVHFAFGENIGAEDLMAASVLAIALKSMADLIRNVPDDKLRGELLTRFVTENLPGVRKSGTNAFIVEHVAQLAQQFVEQAYIAKSA